jgi:hypothetical protein
MQRAIINGKKKKSESDQVQYRDTTPQLKTKYEIEKK